ncbi:MAG: response regulator [Candidatus Micrarchaeota archaeon]
MPPVTLTPTKLAALGRKPSPKRDPMREPPIKRRSILVVDDDPAVRRLLERILVLEGYIVRMARNGKEGSDAFISYGADLVISDMHMPEMNGLEMLKEIRGASPNAKVIILSGGATDEDRDAMEAAGAFCVMRKPVEFEKLVAALGDALSG